MPPSRKPWAWRWGAVFAMAATVIGFAVYVNSLRQDIESQKTQISLLKAEIARQQELLALLGSPQVNIVVMKGLDPTPQGHGTIMWDPTRKKAVLYVTNLPSAPSDKEYQLWQIVDDKPVSAGLFRVRTETGEIFTVEPTDVGDLKRINAFAVTLEPKGGVPQPTGPMHLLGKPSL